MIRARDGYWLVATIQPGDKMPCRTIVNRWTGEWCGNTLPVPMFEFAEVTCEKCKLAKRNYRHQAAFFELTDRLLEHLRKIDPNRGGYERIQMELVLAEERRIASAERTVSNHIEDVTKDNLNSLFDVAHTGYTGRAVSWDHK